MSPQKPTVSTKRYLWNASKSNKKFFAALIFVPLSAICLGILTPYLISSILAKLASNQADTITRIDFIRLGVVALAGLYFNRTGFAFLLTSQASALENMQNKVLDSLVKKSASFFDNSHTGKLTSDAFGITESLLQFQDILVINALPFSVTLIGGISIVALQSISLAIGLALICIIVILTALYSSKKRKPLRIKRHAALRELRGYFADIITNNAAVRLFAREPYELKHHSILNEKLTQQRLIDWLQITRDGSNRIGSVVAMQIIFITVVVQLVKSDPSLLATGIFAFTFTVTLSNKLFDINTMIRGYENAITNAEPMVRLLQTDPEVKDPKTPLPFTVSSGELAFNNVTFWYGDSGSKKALFDNLTLTVKPGEKIGLVGPSGGGKTTLTKLLLRLMDIQDGSICVDGQDISKSKQREIRLQISYVPQDALLFHRSIKDNIGYGSAVAKDNHIIKAASNANADGFIKTLPDGYDTIVGERGVKLSGGQKQRIAIARAMLKNAPILVLDEATSALDSESELLIQDALWKLMKNKTAIVIAHRLSTIQKMDRIIVIDKGKIVEEGPHKQLIKQKNGLYAKLWAHQSGGFLQD